MSERNSALAAHHKALGSNLEEWNGMGAPWTYNSDPCDEHDAARTAAGLFDVSGLKKVHVRGSASRAVVDHIISRNMAAIPVGRSAYGPVLNDDGGICDDAIIFNVADNHHIVVHGSGECRARLDQSAEGKDVAIEFDDDLHNISLQGPAAVDFLDKYTPIDLPALEYFHQQSTTLFDLPVMISRTGFSGERGFELFATAEHIVPLWEAIVENGAGQGIMPCSFTGLDKIRVEAALLFFPYDMTAENTPWEVDFGWAVSRKKGDFRGKEAVFAREGHDKIKLVGIEADHGDIVDAGADLLIGGNKVGTVNSPAWSHRLNKSLALAHVAPAAAAQGTVYQLKGETVSCSATAVRIPFYDPDKTRTHG